MEGKYLSIEEYLGFVKTFYSYIIWKIEYSWTSFSSGYNPYEEERMPYTVSLCITHQKVSDIDFMKNLIERGIMIFCNPKGAILFKYTENLDSSYIDEEDTL